ncbi:pyruvate,water dikinase [Lipingzhangella halophila]|uniref:Pyruvate,water dikinase n=1 Tax=Lipingzhangella halophila TaxID=1783352 RepID=A0A7W7W4F3_9ACTN|nr:PEP/pyruvate-binding domain-containing protein [Lipingzhangella halophila]MBB4932685.1 pyruvate,water dikinase [Lipingzhangella halophila]
MPDSAHAAVGAPAAPAADRPVAPLDTLSAADLDRAGGKGANLGELVRAGYRVPGGFVVTTDAYTAVVDRGGLAQRIDERLAAADGSADDAARAAAAIRSEFAAAEIPEEVRAAIVAAYAELGAEAVAVRSSATAEDLPGAAFAGQQDTYLNVVGQDALLDAVRHCWGSLWTDRAISYRRRRGIDSGAVRIAVVVQAMVPAESAGVLLCANPVTGARDELVVDASSGLGEAVVSGLVTPDHYVLDRRGRIREWTPGQREVVVRGTAGGGIAHDSTGEETAGEQLPAGVLTELARLGTAVSEHFGRPQDMEWALADGTVWLLQARPMTALPPAPVRLNRIQRRVGPVILEMFPYRPYPLDMSAWVLPGPGRLVSRMMAEIPGLRVDLRDVAPEVDGVVDRFVPPNPRPTPAVLTAPARILGRIRRYDPERWTQDPRFTTFQRRIAELNATEWRSVPWDELRRVPRRALDALDLVTDLRVDYLPRSGMSLLRLRLALRFLGRGDLFSSLIMGATTRTVDNNRALEALARHVRDDDRLRAAFAELDGDALVERVHASPEFADFRAALDAFRAEFGHRETASALLLSAPTMGEAPATILGMVRTLVTRPAEPTADQSPDLAGDALRRLLAHPRAQRPRRRARLPRMVRAARSGVGFREDSHFELTRPLPPLRNAVLEMGRRLASAGVLGDQWAVLHLRREELEDLPDPDTLPEADAARLRATADARSAKRAELAGVPLISPAVRFHDSGPDTDALATGTAAGGGRATGPVRVIREPAEFGNLRTGDILVCPNTNPSWTPLFQSAAAVVVDTGGLGSHAAIVAREYGIPAIMGSATGTATLTDGRLVTVDGDRGRVTAAEPDGTADRPEPRGDGS